MIEFNASNRWYREEIIDELDIPAGWIIYTPIYPPDGSYWQDMGL